MTKCQRWLDPAAKTECQNEARWRPIILLRAPALAVAANPAGDVPMSIKVNLALCDAHRQEGFEWREFLTHEGSDTKTSLFTAVSRALAASGKAQPDLARTEVRWEPLEKPFISEPPGHDA